MDRRTKVIVALLFLALLAVASGLWRRFQPAPAPASTQVKADGYRILTSGMVEAADEHRAVIAEAMQVPNEVEAAEAQSRAASQALVQPPAQPTPTLDRGSQVVLPAVPRSQEVLIGFSGGEVGDTDPCGCAHNPLGGLAKRVHLWQQQVRAHPNALAFDVGGMMVPNIPDTADRPGEAVARADVYLRAMARAGYAGLNVGAHELALGLTDLRRLAAANHIALLSANLYDQEGKPAFQRTFIKQLGPLKVGVFGLITAQPGDILNTMEKQSLRLETPNTAAAAVVKELRMQGCDVVIALSQLSRVEVDSLMAQVSGIDLVLGSGNMDLTNQLLADGDGFFADTFTKGKYMGLLTISARSKGRLYAANMRAALNAQRAELAAQVQSLQMQIEQSGNPSAPVKLSKEGREIIDHQLAALRARMQRVTLELDAGPNAPEKANTVELEMAPMSQELVDDPETLKWLDKLKVKYPKIPGR